MSAELQYAYDVAISYAGEDRNYAQTLADALRLRNVKVFYDRYERTTLWGKNLYEYLSDLYQHKSRYCVMLLSQHYASKVWTTHERRAAQNRAVRENEEYILPICLDDTVFLDNLTISCAVRALRTTSSPIPVDRDDASQRPTRRAKWDYDLNDAFRWAVDIFSLAQLIEAIVLLDHILVDVSHIDRWGLVKVVNEGQGIELLDSNAEKVGSLIVPLQPNPLERLRLVCQAIEFIEQTTRNSDLHEFIKLLSETSTDSVFVHISNGYFETGYSDKMLFPDSPLRWAYDLIFNDLETKFTQTWYKNLTQLEDPEFLS